MILKEKINQQEFYSKKLIQEWFNEEWHRDNIKYIFNRTDNTSTVDLEVSGLTKDNSLIKTVVIEIKQRNNKFKNYDSWLLEEEKYNSLQNHQNKTKWYCNFFVNDDNSYDIYIYDLKNLKEEYKNTLYCPKTSYSTNEYKKNKSVYLIPKESFSGFTYTKS